MSSRKQRLEVISRKPKNSNGKPPVLFVHGAFAGAWCWDEHFLPWFAERGYEVHALSLSGHNGSRTKDDSLDMLGIEDYLQDVMDVADGLDEPPILIGHSMGGFITQKFMERRKPAGAVLLASVPPLGLTGPAMSMALNHPWLTWQIGMFEVFGMRRTSVNLLHDALFSSAMDPRDSMKFLPHVQRESLRATTEMYFSGLPIPALLNSVPTLVAGGGADKLIDPVHVISTGIFYGVQAKIFGGVGHGMMLDVKWEDVASHIHEWLEQTSFS